MVSDTSSTLDFLRRGNAVITKEVVLEKPIYVEKDCPPCPDCDEDKVINVETLQIKGDGDIYVKPRNSKQDVQVSADVISNNSWLFGDDCEIHTPQEITLGKYAITSLKNIEPSHIPPLFYANPKYPKGCNERDYQTDTSEQGKVVKYANSFNAKFLINDDNTPANGTIIVDKDGIVYGGNGRTMILAMVVSEFPNHYKKYYELLLKKASSFGIDAAKIKNIELPVLVRVISTDKEKNCNYYSRIFNENMNNKLDELSLAISYVNSLGRAKVNKIASNIASAISLLKFDGKTSLTEIMNASGVLPYLMLVLKNAKLINDTNYNTYIVNIGGKERFTKSAVPLVENLFYAMIFEDKITIEYVKLNSSIKVERIFGNLIEIKAFEGMFNIIPQLNKTIEKFAIQQSITEKKLNAKDIYTQENMYDEYRVRKVEYLCMRLLELKDKAQQQNVLINYIRLVKNLAQGLWAPEDQAQITPERLLEMSFDEANVKYILANLGDKKRKKKRRVIVLDDKPNTLADRITNWFRNDFRKKYVWEK